MMIRSDFPVRRTLGVIGLAATAVVAVLYVLGVTRLVAWTEVVYRFGNPATGLLVVSLMATVTLWVGFPVGDETRPHGRIGGRIVTAVGLVLGLFAWGIFGDHFHYEAEEIARAPAGELAVALVRDGDTPPQQHLALWRGDGVSTREIADLGPVCGGRVDVRFTTSGDPPVPAAVEVDTSYGTWRLPLDPDTAAPQQLLAPGCATPPVPAADGRGVATG